MTPEGRVKNQICSWLKLKGVQFWVNDSVGIYDPKRGAYRRNMSPYRIKGVSDILGILPGGRFLAIEVKIPAVKTPDGKLLQQKSYPTQEQRDFIDMISAMGGLAFVARSIEDVKAELTRAGVL